jgi:methyltransferase-like protein
MTDNNNPIPQRNDNLLERDLDDEIIVMSPEGNVLHTFEGSARFIWGMIDGTHTIEAILDGITEEYQVGTATARSDLEKFLAELQELSLIK